MDVFQLVGKITINGQSEFDSAVKGMSQAAKKVAKVTAAAVTAVGTAMVTLGKKSLDAYADYEQLFGGIQALFDNNAAAQEKVVATGTKAWQDLTMSQNDYYKSFMSSYPLIKASIEDQNAAIDTTNRLLALEADLANTFGGDVSNYANAINWALKGTYSYLDNLNIGIAGTAAGFLEAANNSGLFDKKLKSLDELTSDQKLAVLEHYAEQYGVLGRTAAEAAGTIQGSTLMMKAAWQNLLIGFADETQDVSVLVEDLLTSCVTVAKNVVPRIVQIFQGILDAVPEIVEQVKGYFFEMFPGLEEKFTVIQGHIDNLSESFAYLKDAVMEAVQPIIDKLSEYVSSGEAAEDATNFLKDAIDMVGSAAEWVADKLTAFSDWCKENPDEVEAIAIIIGSFAAAFGLVTTAVTVATSATAIFSGALALLTSPVTLAVVAIGTLIAAGVALYKNWDQVKAAGAELWENLKSGFGEMVDNAVANFTKLKEQAVDKFTEIKESVGSKVSELASKAVSKFNEMKSSAVDKFNEMKSSAVDKASELKDSVAGKFGEIKSSIQEKIESARDAVKDAIDKIKSFFDFSWELPKIKLPHFSASGSFSLNPPSVPSFSVSWYKKAYENAMVLSDPTIFGYSSTSGKMLGGGEGNGNEVVAGEAHLMNMIQEAVAAQNEALVYYLQTLVDMLADYFPQVIAASSHDIVTNDGAIIARYAPMFNTALGKISVRKDRGR